jgi:P-type Cu+ transporter
MRPTQASVECPGNRGEKPDNPPLGNPLPFPHDAIVADAPITFRPMRRDPRTAAGSVPAPPPRPGPEASKRPSARTRLVVDGMTCSNCVRHVTDTLAGTPGVSGATVDLDSSTATVDWANMATVRPELLLERLSQAGFQAREWIAKPTDVPNKQPTANPWSPSLRIGLPVAGLLMLGDWVFGLGLNKTFQSVSFLVATAMVWLLGRRFFLGAFNQIRAGGANMDTLVSLGVTAAMGYSVPALFANLPGHLFFTETVTLLAFVGTGHYLEHRMSVKAGSALRALLGLVPQTATRLQLSGEELAVPIADLTLEDRIVLRPGDRVPVDAIVVDGHSAVDESMLTGESMPVEKAPGHPLFAGTANRNGRLVASVTAIGEETALSRIADVIRRAQSTRASVQRLADRISAIFVPIVVGIAVAAALWWILAPESAGAAHALAERWLWHSHLPASNLATAAVVACAVLVIACPCAMGLATPAALMAGVNNAARRGILVRDAAVLETCGTIDTLLFDKTGTLTVGRPTVVASATFVPSDPECHPMTAAISDLAAALARKSAHPLSNAIAQAAPGNEPLTEWTEIAGIGLRARWKDHVVRLASIRSLEKEGIDTHSTRNFTNLWAKQGATPVLLAIDQNVVAAFALRDSLRPEAIDVIRQLRASGYRIGMLSGDHPMVAQAIAREVGIDASMVHAEVPPEGKSGHLAAERTAGHRVAFVGDGINDGPALAAADLGIAVARASDVAREAAGLVLLRTNLAAVPEALDLARATLRTIRQNLFWAFFYNTAAVPLAALGLVNPALCAAAMGLSDLIVVGNALRLARRSPREFPVSKSQSPVPSS